MNSKQATISMLAVSIIAAAAIIISSQLGGSQTITYTIIAIWFVPFSWLAAQAGKEKSSEE